MTRPTSKETNSKSSFSIDSPPTLLQWPQVQEEIDRLCQIEDPDTKPYCSKYQARSIIQKYIEFLQAEQQNDEIKKKIAVLNCRLGVIATSVEEPHEAALCLNKSLGYFFPTFSAYIEEKHPLTEEPDVAPEDLPDTLSFFTQDISIKDTLLQIELLNQLGILWSNREHEAKALCFLQATERLYHETHDIVGSEDELRERNIKFAQTLFYLAQVHAKLNNPAKSAEYCQMTLERQLTFPSFDEVDWIRNCCTLASYYSTNHRFQQAAHCLTACEYQFQKLEGEPANTKEKKDDTDTRDLLHANIYRGFGDLYLEVLMVAHQIQSERSAKQADFKADQGQMDELLNEFEVLNLEKTPRMNAAAICSFPDAREVFKKGNSSYTKALQYYVLDGFVTEHVRILQSISALYRHLASFEPQDKRRLAMHLRRAKLLEPIAQELNPQYYADLRCALAYELGECYNELQRTKEDLMELQSSLRSSEVIKCNAFASSAINYFKQVLEAYPNPSEQDELVVCFNAHFYIARLCTKFLELPAHHNQQLLKTSMENYEAAIKFGERCSSSSILQQQISMSKEMLELLPQRIDQLSSSTS